MATSKTSAQAINELVKNLSPCGYDELIEHSGLSYSTIRNAIGLLRLQGHVAVTNTRPALITFLKEIPSRIETVVVEKEIKNPSVTTERKNYIRAMIMQNKDQNPIADVITEFIDGDGNMHNLYQQLVNAAEVVKEDYLLGKDELKVQSLLKHS